MPSSSRTAIIKPGMVRSHPTIVEPKVSVQLVYRRVTSMIWLTPREAEELANKLIHAACKCKENR